MSQPKRQKSGLWIKLGILGIVVISIVLIFRFTPLTISSFTPENMKNFVHSFGVLAPIVFIVIYALRAVILVLPVGVMSLAGGLAFGKWLGTLYILIGATAGACLSFLFARYLGRGFIEKLGVLKRGRLKSFDDGVEKNGFRMILFMRLIPLFQYDALNFGAGFSKMKLRDYALGSFIGMIPGGFINAMLGSSLENIISVQFFVALGLFFLLMFVPAIYSYVKKKRKSENVSQTKETKKKLMAGVCPDCGVPIGPLAILTGWTRWGRFDCPGCEHTIGFKGWFFVFLVLYLLYFGIFKLMLGLMAINSPLWITYLIVFILSLFVLMFVTKMWRYRRVAS